MFFFLQAEDGIRDAQESRGLGDVYKRQTIGTTIQYQGFTKRNIAARVAQRDLKALSIPLLLSLIHI